MDSNLTPFDSFGDSDPGSSLARNEAPGGDLGSRIQRSLRGRYWIILPLSLLAGLAGGYFGYKSQKPQWKSDGNFQIAYYIPSPIPGYNPNGEEIKQYDQWMLTQTAIMGSHAIIDKALMEPAWRATGRGAGLAAYQQFIGGLSIDHPVQTQIIHVACTDTDPGVAAAAVKSIISAYEKYYAELQRVENVGDLTAMHSAEHELINVIDQDRGDIRRIAREVAGSSNFDVFYNLKVTQVAALVEKLHDAELAVAMSGKEGGADVIDQLTNNQIGMLDPTMREKIARRETMEHELEGLLYRLGDKNEMVVGKKVQIAQLEDSMTQYAQEFRDLQRKLASGHVPGATGQMGGGFQLLNMSRASLVEQQKALRALLDTAQAEMKELGAKQMEVQTLQMHMEEKARRLTDLQRQIETYVISNSHGGRLGVISYGELPVAPFKDRRSFVGAAAGLGGALAPVLCVICLGVFDRRYRYSDEAEGKAGQPPLLGILPTLPDHLADPEQASIAAHCIHQIRIMLQVGSPLAGKQEAKRVFMVTSSNTGDGKTSLTMALGLSFAASGSRTLVMDCDMVGQGLTHRLKASQSPGLHESLVTGSLQGRVKKTTTTNLYVLPIGGCDAGHAGSLSPESMKRLLNEAKKVFDIVVIDTGPILGSLEACVVGTAADAVVLAVSRGQNQPMVERAVRQLRSVGANIAGLVFNRAEKRDFNRSVGSASIRSQSIQPVAPKMLISEGDEPSRFGPLARSVASFMPGMTRETDPETTDHAASHEASGEADDKPSKKKRKKDRVGADA